VQEPASLFSGLSGDFTPTANSSLVNRIITVWFATQAQKRQILTENSECSLGGLPGRVMTLAQLRRRALFWRQDNTEPSSSRFNETEAFLDLVVIDLFLKNYRKDHG